MRGRHRPTIKIDVRVLVATNRKLDKLIEQAQVRQDLYYRLNGFPIHHVPPLRERDTDILLLANHFAEALQPRKLQGYPAHLHPGHRHAHELPLAGQHA